MTNLRSTHTEASKSFNKEFASSDRKMVHRTREEMQIAIANAASIGVMKTIRQLGLSIDEPSLKDLKSDAMLAALTHVDPEREGALSYADRCGRNCVLMSLRKRSRGPKNVSIERDMTGVERIADDALSMAALLEEERQHDMMMDRLGMSINGLTDSDKSLLRLCMKGIRYGEIAQILGCTEGTARKKSHDMRKRIMRSMERLQGYAA